VSLAGLLLPSAGDPVVLRHRHWDTAAIINVVGSGHLRGVVPIWSPSGKHEILLFAAGDGGPPNLAATALGGVQAQPLGGDVLVLGVANRNIIGLSKEVLLIIATRLMVAAAVAGELPA